MKKPQIIDIDGIKLIYENVKINNNFALLPIFTTGSIDETDENSGVTHFLEHMLAKETENKTSEQTSAILLKYFPRYNASTSTDMMKVNCETSIKHIEIGFEFFADVILNSIFNEEKVAKEKKVIEQEIVRYDAENDAVAYQLMESTIFKFPFAKNGILGDRQNILSTTAKDLENRYNQLACKENLVFSFAGNVPIEEVEKLIRKYFSNLPSKPENKIQPINIDFNGEEKVALIKKESERCNVILVQKLECDEHDEKQILCRSILNYYLNRMMGKLWNKLREEKGLVYSYYCYDRHYEDKKIKVFEFETYKDNIKECLNCYENVLSDIYLNGIELEDFETIKENFIMINDAFIPTPYSNALMNFKTFQGKREFFSIEEKNQMIENLQHDDFNAIIKKFLYSDFMALCVVGNVEQEELITIENLKALFKKPENN